MRRGLRFRLPDAATGLVLVSWAASVPAIAGWLCMVGLWSLRPDSEVLAPKAMVGTVARPGYNCAINNTLWALKGEREVADYSWCKNMGYYSG